MEPAVRKSDLFCCEDTRIGLQQAYIAPAVLRHSVCGSRQHARRVVRADNGPCWADRGFEQREVQARAAGQVEHSEARLRAKLPCGVLPVGIESPSPQRGHRRRRTRRTNSFAVHRLSHLPGGQLHRELTRDTIPAARGEQVRDPHPRSHHSAGGVARGRCALCAGVDRFDMKSNLSVGPPPDLAIVRRDELAPSPTSCASTWTRRFCSSAQRAVISEPLSSAASTTTVPSAKPLISRFRRGKWNARGGVPQANSVTSAPCGTISQPDPRGRRDTRGRSRYRARRPPLRKAGGLVGGDRRAYLL